MSASTTYRPNMAPSDANASFKQRQIEVEFKIGKGDHGEGGTETRTIRGARVSAVIQRTPTPYAQAQIRVFGLSLADMNKLTTLHLPHNTAARYNLVTVRAGDPIKGLATAYTGLIQEAWGDFNDMPNCNLVISSHTAALDAMRPVAPSSYAGPVDAVTILQDIAGRMAYTLETNGISGIMLGNAYYPGTLRDQAAACAEAAHLDLVFDDSDAVMSISQKLGGRTSLQQIPLISPATGLVGYPTYAENGAIVRVLFNPALRVKGWFNLQTSIKPACGIWCTISLTHMLDSQVANGQWFSEMEAYKLGNPSTLPSR